MQVKERVRKIVDEFRSLSWYILHKSHEKQIDKDLLGKFSFVGKVEVNQRHGYVAKIKKILIDIWFEMKVSWMLHAL